MYVAWYVLSSMTERAVIISSFLCKKRYGEHAAHCLYLLTLSVSFSLFSIPFIFNVVTLREGGLSVTNDGGFGGGRVNVGEA